MNAIETVRATNPRHIGAGWAFAPAPAGRAPHVALPALSADDVGDLISAAGPLTVCDIAGGLAAPVARAAACVRQMVRARELKRDEFGRYRLWGVRAM